MKTKQSARREEASLGQHLLYGRWARLLVSVEELCAFASSTSTLGTPSPGTTRCSPRIHQKGAQYSYSWDFLLVRMGKKSDTFLLSMFVPESLRSSLFLFHSKAIREVIKIRQNIQISFFFPLYVDRRMCSELKRFSRNPSKMVSLWRSAKSCFLEVTSTTVPFFYLVELFTIKMRRLLRQSIPIFQRKIHSLAIT